MRRHIFSPALFAAIIVSGTCAAGGENAPTPIPLLETTEVSATSEDIFFATPAVHRVGEPAAVETEKEPRVRAPDTPIPAIPSPDILSIINETPTPEAGNDVVPSPTAEIGKTASPSPAAGAAPTPDAPASSGEVRFSVDQSPWDGREEMFVKEMLKRWRDDYRQLSTGEIRLKVRNVIIGVRHPGDRYSIETLKKGTINFANDEGTLRCTIKKPRSEPDMESSTPVSDSAF